MASDSMRNPALYESLRALLPLARQLFEQKEFPFHLWNEIQQTGEFQRCVQLMREDATIGRHIDQLVSTNLTLIRVDANSYISRLFSRVYEASLDDYTGRFDTIYREFEDFFFADYLEVEVISPLLDFKLEGEEIDLGNSINITVLPADIKTELAKPPTGPLPAQDIWRLVGTRHCLYSVIRDMKRIGTEPQTEKKLAVAEAVRTMSRMLECLRLFQPGTISSPFILSRIKGWAPLPTMFSFSLGSQPPLAARSLYEVQAGKVEELFDFCSWCSKAIGRATRDVEIANRRFNFSYERHRPEDIVVDLMIALESLFLDQEPGEFGYRLGMRVASLLGRPTSERQKIFAFISISYKQRNKIVHGGEIPKHVRIPNEGNVEFKSFVSRLEDYVRQSIRKLLEMDLPRRQRIKKLEQRILSSHEAETR